MKTGAFLKILFLTALLVGCSAPRFNQKSASGVDKEFARFSQMARSAYDKGSLAQAEVFYRQAHQRAREMDSPQNISDAAYNLAAVLLARDRVAEAKPLLDESEKESRRIGQTPVDVWLVQAQIAVREKRISDALRGLNLIEKSAALQSAQRVETSLLRGQIFCDQGNVAEARRQLTIAKSQRNAANKMLGAGVEKLSGRIASLEGNHAEAAAAFHREAEFCRLAGQHRAMAQALARASEAFAQAGDNSAAANCAYRAARSFLAQGNMVAAQSSITHGEKWAEASGDNASQNLLHQLAAEIISTQPQ